MTKRLIVIVLLLLVAIVGGLIKGFAGAAIVSIKNPGALSCTAASCSCSALLSGLDSSNNETRYFARGVVYHIILKKLGLGSAESESLDAKTFAEQTQLLTTLCKANPDAPMRDVAGTFIQGR